RVVARRRVGVGRVVSAAAVHAVVVHVPLMLHDPGGRGGVVRVAGDGGAGEQVGSAAAEAALRWGVIVHVHCGARDAGVAVVVGDLERGAVVARLGVGVRMARAVLAVVTVAVEVPVVADNVAVGVVRAVGCGGDLLVHGHVARDLDRGHRRAVVVHGDRGGGGAGALAGVGDLELHGVAARLVVGV